MKPCKIKVKNFFVIMLLGGLLILCGVPVSFATEQVVATNVVATGIETIDLTTDGKNIGVTVTMTKDANAQNRAVTSNMATTITPKNVGAITSMGKCGDSICDSYLNEDTENCPEDCLHCGDSLCSVGENCSSCVQDCGECACGNGTCDTGEDHDTCLQDCPFSALFLHKRFLE